jgi:Tol biopolymer transport system component
MLRIAPALPLLLSLTLAGEPEKKIPLPPSVPHFGDVYQLTFGGSNAEAYWAPDGRRIIFQATRDPYQCDQIYTMNADGSQVKMVSTGKGRTTCGYFLKDNKHILYASTHEGGEACPPEPDRSKGYVWAIYDTFDIYLATDQGQIVRKLTDAKGYDAEATVNFKSGKVTYTSLASGDIEVWEMNADGTRKKQLTRTKGYDGGPVYSPSGKQIVMRSNHPKAPADVARYEQLLKDNLTSPMRMEIFVMDANGKNQRQVTNFGCASFAPTWTPDGKKILFASNKNNCDGRKFELFLMNPDGSGLEQVTDLGGFTSFPEFSPDGKWLLFCSDYRASKRYEFNIFKASWK